MYWDISLHIDDGRDAGPLANPAHYFILIGLFGIFASGVLAIALPKDGERPGPPAVRITEGLVRARRRHPDRGLRRLLADRLPARRRLAPHLRPGRDALGPDPPDADRRRRHDPDRRRPSCCARACRRARAPARTETLAVRHASCGASALAGGLLIGASTFQAEFDFGVPQFSQVLHPVLIAFAAGLALVAGRMMIGPGGALGAAVFFLVVRGVIGVIVGPGLGEVFPYMPLYLGEAVVRRARGARARPRSARSRSARPRASRSAPSGSPPSTRGPRCSCRCRGPRRCCPRADLVAVLAGIAGATLGALLGAALRGELPRPGIARPAFAASLVVIAGADGQRPGHRGAQERARPR